MGRTRGPIAASADEDGQRSKRRRLAAGDAVDKASLGDGKKPPLYHCSNCHKDITGTVRTRCPKCPDFDLCLECMSVGVEPEILAFPLIHPDWNADEELLLLEGVESFGVGDWTEVSEHVGTKSKVQCYEHYMAFYMDSPFSPLPDLTHIAGKTKADLLNKGKLHAESKKHSSDLGDAMRMVKQEPVLSYGRIKGEEGLNVVDGRASSDALRLGFSSTSIPVGRSNHGKLGSDQGEAITSVQLSDGEVVASGVKSREGGDDGSGGHNNRSVGGKQPKAEVETTSDSLWESGYLPKRHEFDPEYDNDADQLLAEMEFKENDTETDRELKLRILHFYLARLSERRYRKDFVVERGLMNSKYQAAVNKRMSKEENELYRRMRIFLRYHSNGEHDELLSGLGSERKLRERMEELQEMRVAGCRLRGGGHFAERGKQEAEVLIDNARGSSPALQGGKFNQRSSLRLKKEPGDGELSPSGDVRGNSRSWSGGQSSISGGNGARSGKKASRVRDACGYSGMESLSYTERELCMQCRLLPKQYLKMKEVLLGERARNGHINKSDAYALFKIEPIKTERVYELLVNTGWIQGDSSVVNDRGFSVA